MGMTFKKELVLAAAERSRRPTGHALLDEIFQDYNSVPFQQARNDQPFYYRFLYYLARLLKGERLAMVELGCKYGAASIHFLRGGGEAVLAVDKTNVMGEKLFAREFKSGALKFRQTNSLDPGLLPVANWLEPNIAFIDTDHEYSTTAAEYAMWRPVIERNRGLMLFDDICESRYGCARFWEELDGDTLTFPELHPDGWGFGILFT
jgi:cephalosporin hydroxylase